MRLTLRRAYGLFGVVVAVSALVLAWGTVGHLANTYARHEDSCGIFTRSDLE